MEPNTSHKSAIIIAVIATLGAGCIGYTGYWGYQKYTALEQAKASVDLELAKTKQEFASTTEDLTTNIEAMKQLLAATNADKTTAEQGLNQQQEVLDSMAKTLGVYEKIVTTDRELLIKYSRVYFLSENYSPRHSIVIPASYTFETTEKMFLAEAWPFLKNMLDDANSTGIDLKVLSAYRSFDTQSKLKTAYTITYGTGANKFSADQGYSEHQLGTAIDFTTAKLGANYTTFAKNAAYTWLAQNAYKYGFILSYPAKNTYYIFEPWHWRFVGKALAQKLHDENKNFVDLTQREIDTYLGSLFDGSPATM